MIGGVFNSKGMNNSSVYLNCQKSVNYPFPRNANSDRYMVRDGNGQVLSK